MREVLELSNENIESMIYEIRNERVMLDFDLARLLGYATKTFNQQVLRNIDSLDANVRFMLTKDELTCISRSQNVTAIIQTKGIKGGRTTMPYAFTEKGIYNVVSFIKPKTESAKNNVIFLTSYFSNGMQKSARNSAKVMKNYEILQFYDA